MAKLLIIAVGDKMPAWVNQACADYAQRLPSNNALNLIAVPALKRGKNADLARIVQREGASLLAQIPPRYQLVALERGGKHLDSLALAKQLAIWQTAGQGVAFALGGPEGLHRTVIDSAQYVWSLSALTFSHHVARVLLAEQLYRAWSINQGMPYHR